MLLDFAALQQHAPLKSHAVPDHHIRPNRHVRSDLTIVSNLCRRIDHDIPTVNVRLAVGRQQLAAFLGQRGQIQAGPAEEILGLTDVHPESLEVKRVQLAVRDHGWECLLFDGRGAQLDALEHGWVENVDTRVDPVAHELDRLLHEPIDARRVVRLVHDHTVLGWLLDLGHHNRAFLPVRGVEVRQLLERKITNDIRVQHEERRVVFAQNLFGQFQWPRGPQRLGFHRVLNADVVLLLVLFQRRRHHLRPVVDGEHNVGDARCRKGFDLVHDHGSVAELDQGFGEGEGKRTEAGSETADENESCHSMSTSCKNNLM